MINVGDTVVIRGVVEKASEVVHNRGNVISVITDTGAKFSIFSDSIAEVIPAPRVPKPGEIWRDKVSKILYRVVCIDGERVVRRDTDPCSTIYESNKLKEWHFYMEPVD